MPSNMYSVSELLSLRGSQSSEQLDDKARSDVELGGILRRKDGSKPSRARQSEQSSESTVADSEKSTVVRHPTRKSDSQWKYRGRSNSELNTGRPILAPASLVVQKDEGFQRFYKAVVSPTHVRVTAGGRIVPNNRAPASPTSKVSKDKPVTESNAPTHTTPQATAHATTTPSHQTHPPSQIPSDPVQVIFNPPTHPPPMALVYPGQYPGMYPHPSAMPFLPLPVTFNMYGNGFSGPAVPQFPRPAGVQMYHDPRRPEHFDPAADKAGQVFVPSTENMDPNRQFLYPEPWLMPTGPPVYPYGMMPPGYFPTPPPGSGYPFHNVFPSPAPYRYPDNDPGHEVPQPPPLAPQAMQSKAAAEIKAPPLISSIRPSEITKKQIVSLRSNLKYFEDQLQLNKHQIDERSMEYQAQIVRTHILHFERILDQQLSDEEVLHSCSDSRLDNSTSAISGASQRSTEVSSVSDVKSEKCAISLGTDNQPRTRTGVNSSRRAKSIFAGTSLEGPLKGTAPNRAGRIPIGAAMAQPFEPSSEALSPPKLDGKSTFANEVRGQGQLLYNLNGVPAISKLGLDASSLRGLSDNEINARQKYWGMISRTQELSSNYDDTESHPPSPTKDKAMKLKTCQASEESEQHSQRGEKLKMAPVDQTIQTWPTSHPVLSEPSVVNNVEGDETRNKSSQKESRKVKYYVPIMTSKKGISVSADAEVNQDYSRLANRSTDRTTGKVCNELWNSMVKKTPTSSLALPGTVTSMTARGYLPRYGGHAAAMLSPVIANALPSQRSLLAMANTERLRNRENVPFGHATSEVETATKQRDATGNNTAQG